MLKRHKWISVLAILILAYFLITEHRAHMIETLPYLFLLACPFMHLFMHKGHHDLKHQGPHRDDLKRK